MDNYANKTNEDLAKNLKESRLNDQSENATNLNNPTDITDQSANSIHDSITDIDDLESGPYVHSQTPQSFNPGSSYDPSITPNLFHGFNPALGEGLAGLGGGVNGAFVRRTEQFVPFGSGYQTPTGPPMTGNYGMSNLSGPPFLPGTMVKASDTTATNAEIQRLKSDVDRLKNTIHQLEDKLSKEQSDNSALVLKIRTTNAEKMATMMPKEQHDKFVKQMKEEEERKRADQREDHAKHVKDLKAREARIKKEKQDLSDARDKDLESQRIQASKSQTNTINMANKLNSTIKTKNEDITQLTANAIEAANAAELKFKGMTQTLNDKHRVVLEQTTAKWNEHLQYKMNQGAAEIHRTKQQADENEKNATEKIAKLEEELSTLKALIESQRSSYEDKINTMMLKCEHDSKFDELKKDHLKASEDLKEVYDKRVEDVNKQLVDTRAEKEKIAKERDEDRLKHQEERSENLKKFTDTISKTRDDLGIDKK